MVRTRDGVYKWDGVPTSGGTDAARARRVATGSVGEGVRWARSVVRDGLRTQGPPAGYSRVRSIEAPAATVATP
jgi:hypothetical protein